MCLHDTEIDVFGIVDFDPTQLYFEIEINYLIASKSPCAGIDGMVMLATATLCFQLKNIVTLNGMS
jgi:hypothetical protein